jgi:hypothetical protein
VGIPNLLLSRSVRGSLKRFKPAESELVRHSSSRDHGECAVRPGGSGTGDTGEVRVLSF